MNMKSEKIYWYLTLFLSELFASVFLLFLGCLSEVNNSPHFTPSTLTVSLSFGLAVMIGINSFNVTSGGFMSPIISVYFYINKMMDVTTAFVYFAGQMIGSFLGYALVRAVVPDEFLKVPGEFCISHPNIDVGRAFVIEFMAAFIFITFVAAVLHPKNARWHDSATIKFGLLVVCLVLVCGPFTISLNPARSFAPAVYNWHWKDHWMYWIAPFSGSLVASVLYKFVFGRDFSHLKENHHEDSPKTVTAGNNDVEDTKI